MKKIILYFIVITLFLFFTCKTLEKKNNINNQSITNIQKENKIIEKEKKEEKIFFELIEVKSIFNEKESKISSNNIYELKYNIVFTFKSNSNNFIINYILFDEDNNILIKRENIKALSINEKNYYKIEESFIDKFSYRIIRYKFEVLINNNKQEFYGEVVNKDFPVIEKLEIGPYITQIENKKKFSYLKINIKITNCSKIVWCYFIPPSMDTYWEIPYRFIDNNESLISQNTIICNATIKNKNNLQYFINGEYLVQLNFGYFGIMQKKIILKDLNNNINGYNYGLLIGSEESSDKDTIKLDIHNKELIEKMELWFYNSKDNSDIAGISKYLSPVTLLSKKELKENIENQYGEKIKIKLNKKYYYKIYLYSKEINNLKYISISDFIPIIFQGFSFFN